jgi:hypothetical protein
MKGPISSTTLRERYITIYQFLGCLVLIILVSASSFVVGRICEKKEQDDLCKIAIAEIIIANTKIMQESESVFRRLKNNSDIMMRYSHYLNNHDPSVRKVVFCPECWSEEGVPEEVLKLFVTEFEDVLEEVPETFAQIMKDCQELEGSITRINSSLWAQSITLHRNLKQLSDGTFIATKDAK